MFGKKKTHENVKINVVGSKREYEVKIEGEADYLDLIYAVHALARCVGGLIEIPTYEVLGSVIACEEIFNPQGD